MKRTPYIPSNGGIIFSAEKHQYFNNSDLTFFDYLSDVKNNLHENNSRGIDSCMNSKEVYVIGNNQLIKLNYYGDVLNDYNFGSGIYPDFISVIQHKALNPYVKGEGCWVGTGNGLYRLDEDLNLKVHINDFTDIKWIQSCQDGGCYIVDNGSDYIYRLDENGFIISSISLSEMDIIDYSYIKDLDIDRENNLWIATYDKIFVVDRDSLIIKEIEMLNLISSGSEGEDYIEDIYVEKYRSSNRIYVASFISNEGWLSSIDNQGNLINSSSISGENFLKIKSIENESVNLMYIVSGDDSE